MASKRTRIVLAAALAAGMAFVPTGAVPATAADQDPCRISSAAARPAPGAHSVTDVNELTPQEVADAERRSAERRAALGLSLPALADPVRIRVTFHILTGPGPAGEGTVPMSQINRTMERLNSEFAGAGGAATRFLFPPQEMTVIVRSSPEFPDVVMESQEDVELRDMYRRGNIQDLNIYTGRPYALDQGQVMEILGSATWPWNRYFAPTYDGVFVDYRTLYGGSMAGYNEGDTLVHEIGHWLGLYHTWTGGCKNANGGDQVADTPVHAGPNLVCERKDSCPLVPRGEDPIANFMNYTPDTCMSYFTPGQAARMSGEWDTWRAVP